MAKIMKAACLAGALGMGLLGATTAARAARAGVPHMFPTNAQPKLPIVNQSKPPIVSWNRDPWDGWHSGGGHSGNAPSPEVNTMLGFLIVAGTVAFIKRRRGTEAEAEDAVV